MKKLVALLLAVLLIPSLSSCITFMLRNRKASADTETETHVTDTAKTDGEQTTEAPDTDVPNDPEKDPVFTVYKNAVEKTNALNDLKMTEGSDIDMKIEIVNVQTTSSRSRTSSDSSISGRHSDDMKMEVHQNRVSESGENTSETNVDVFIDKDNFYYRDNPGAGYTVIARNSEQAEALNSVITPEYVSIKQLPAQAFSGAELTENPDGSKTIVCHPDGELVDVFMSEQMQQLSAVFETMGATDIRTETSSATYRLTVSADGYMVSIEADLNMDMTMTCYGYATKMHTESKAKTEFRDIGSPVNIQIPAVPMAVYSLYIPMYAGTDYTAEIALDSDNTYTLKTDVTQEASGFNIHIDLTEYGSFTFNDAKDRISGKGEGIDLHVGFDSETQKNAYKSALDYAYEQEMIGNKVYLMITKAMSDEGFSGNLTEVKEIMGELGVGMTVGSVNDGLGNIILDNSEMKAYMTVPGLDLKEGQYYIAAAEVILTLEKNGDCSLYGEGTDDDGESYGEYNYSFSYYGKYTDDGMNVTCTFTGYNERITFKSDAALKEYRDTFNNAYAQGLIGEATYDYYMSAVSEDGYTEETGPEIYKFVIEPHTQTAYIAEMPESET